MPHVFRRPPEDYSLTWRILLFAHIDVDVYIHIYRERERVHTCTSLCVCVYVRIHWAKQPFGG